MTRIDDPALQLILSTPLGSDTVFRPRRNRRLVRRKLTRVDLAVHRLVSSGRLYLRLAEGLRKGGYRG